MKRLIVASTILISMLSGTVFSSTLVGTSYASQTSPPPTSICNPNSPLLKLDSTGAKVIELQRYLVQLGYASLLGQGGIDGKFGLSTQNAVKKFQEDAGLKPVDGIVGPRTWGVLCEVMTSVAAAPIQQQQQLQQQQFEEN